MDLRAAKLWAGDVQDPANIRRAKLDSMDPAGHADPLLPNIEVPLAPIEALTTSA